LLSHVVDARLPRGISRISSPKFTRR
jgi:hypothetical protein